jgi:hypothetical protein
VFVVAALIGTQVPALLVGIFAVIVLAAVVVSDRVVYREVYRRGRR